MVIATGTFEVRDVCRICGHAVATVGVTPSGYCSVPDCEDRGWHFHCDRRHSACTTAGCYPHSADDSGDAA